MKISIIGSTGSIGTQTLSVVEEQNFTVTGLVAGKNIDLLFEQVKKFRPSYISVESKEDSIRLSKMIKTLGYKPHMLYGHEGMMEIASLEEHDIVVTSVVGILGLRPTVEIIKRGKRVALANKETLVTAGQVIMPLAQKYNSLIVPVDSEHSAIFQSLQGENSKNIKNIILTASGGPFRGYSREMLKNVTLEEALDHPSWKMGKKITVDSATLMNKGFEVIEAKWLFDVGPKNIKIVAHPQSVIHSMVEFTDSSCIAQLGIPDMRTPIQYALTYPDRIPTKREFLDLASYKHLTFGDVDKNVFGCLRLAFEALETGPGHTVVLNAANEIAVEAFLNKKITFLDIERIISKALERIIPDDPYTIEGILETDRQAREFAESIC